MEFASLCCQPFEKISTFLLTLLPTLLEGMWRPPKSGMFTIKSSCKVFSPGGLRVPLSKIDWDKKQSSGIASFCGLLLTRSFILLISCISGAWLWQLHVASALLGSKAMKPFLHVPFFLAGLVQCGMLPVLFCILPILAGALDGLVTSSNDLLTRKWRTALSAAVYFIWRAHNSVRLGQHIPNSHVLARQILSYVVDTTNS